METLVDGPVEDPNDSEVPARIILRKRADTLSRGKIDQRLANEVCADTKFPNVRKAANRVLADLACKNMGFTFKTRLRL